MASAILTTSNLPRFRAMIDEWDAAQSPARTFTTTVSRLTEPDPGARDGKDVLVAFRTRPPLPGEAETKFAADPNFALAGSGVSTSEDASGGSAAEPEQKVEFCSGLSVRSAEPGVVVAHVPAVKWNGPTITQKTFEADLAFGPDVGNDEVYARTVVATDMLSLVLGGGVGCVLAYGQTGAGKTHTMEALEARIAHAIFPAAEALSERFLASQGVNSLPQDERGEKNIFELSVSFLELLGKRAADLIDVPEGEDAEGNALRKEIAVHENKLGEVRPRLIQTVVRSAQELEQLITRALSHRRTSATLRNATSSRSHAVLTIRARNTLLPYADEGVLILVDLAGSERYEDSKAHNKHRMDESRENNKALMNLKDCVRAKAKAVIQEEGFVHVPFRSNKLTLLLKPIFDLESRQRSKTIIIAHASPHLQDSAHSVSTLSYAAPFKTSPPKRPTAPLPYDAKDPRTWDHAQSVEWIEREFGKRVSKDSSETPEGVSQPKGMVDVERLLPQPMTARNLGRMYANEWVEACLKARVDGTSTEDAEDIKKVAAEVYGQFNYLLLTARLRTRKEVLKSRKPLANMDAAYGDSPGHRSEWIAKVEAYPDEDLVMAQMLHGEEYRDNVMAAIKRAREHNLDVGVERAKAIVEMMEKYKDEVAAEREKASGAP